MLMYPREILLSITLAIGGIGCTAKNVRIPPDSTQIHYSSVDISVNTERTDEMVESGYISGIIFEPGPLVGHNGIWSDGTLASVSIGLSSGEFQSFVKELVREFENQGPVYTYSEWLSGSERDPSLGIHTSDYFSEAGLSPGISIRMSGVKDAYNRSMWLVIPMSQVDLVFWDRLQRVLPDEERFRSFAAGLRTFWMNNA
jgi:hypothetical protein